MARYHKKVISHLFCSKIGKTPASDKCYGSWVYFTNVYTKPSSRNLGIGSKLMEKVEVWAKEENLELMLVWPSDKSFSFFEKAGLSPPTIY